MGKPEVNTRLTICVSEISISQDLEERECPGRGQRTKAEEARVILKAGRKKLSPPFLCRNLAISCMEEEGNAGGQCLGQTFICVNSCY